MYQSEEYKLPEPEAPKINTDTITNEMSKIQAPLIDKSSTSTNVFESCHCQFIRSAGEWSLGIPHTDRSIFEKYVQCIETAEHFIYIENQFFISSSTDEAFVPINKIAGALVKRIIRAHKEGKNFKVVVVMPLLPEFAATITGNLLHDFNEIFLDLCIAYEQRTLIWPKKGLNLFPSMIQVLKDANIDPHKYFNVYCLRNHGEINSKPVTEQIYVHSKMMIVDDRRAIIGSANINDRSMLGYRDLEIAMFMEGNTMIDSKMDGKPYPVSVFAHSLRTELYKQHLGITDQTKIKDPLSNDTNNFLDKTAQVNTETYRYIFKCYPDDKMHKFKDVVRSAEEMKELPLHELQARYNSHKGKIQGQLVQYPHAFLSKEEIMHVLVHLDFFPDIST